MLQPASYQLTCDNPDRRCRMLLVDDNRFRLKDRAVAQGWTLNRTLSGRVARRGGKDYCPEHSTPDPDARRETG